MTPQTPKKMLAFTDKKELNRRSDAIAYVKWDLKIKLSLISVSFNVTDASSQQTQQVRGEDSLHVTPRLKSETLLLQSCIYLVQMGSCLLSPSSSSSVFTASLEYIALRRFFLSMSVILDATVSWKQIFKKLTISFIYLFFYIYNQSNRLVGLSPQNWIQNSSNEWEVNPLDLSH